MNRILIFLLLLPAALAMQDPEFRIDANRDFGYGNGANVRGNFSLTIYGDLETIQAVTYFLDGEEMARVEAPPFKHAFHTGSYPSGWRTITAVVETSDGRQVTTPAVRLNFLSAEQQAEGMKTVFGGLAAILGVLAAVGVLATYLTARGGKAVSTSSVPPGQPRDYGMMGGTICPRCDRPYSVHFWSLSMLVGRLDRCPHCGKWALVRRYPLDVLRAAERAEVNALGGGATIAAETEEERMKRMLDESRYQ